MYLQRSGKLLKVELVHTPQVTSYQKSFLAVSYPKQAPSIGG